MNRTRFGQTLVPIVNPEGAFAFNTPPGGPAGPNALLEADPSKTLLQLKTDYVNALAMRKRELTTRLAGLEQEIRNHPRPSASLRAGADALRGEIAALSADEVRVRSPFQTASPTVAPPIASTGPRPANGLPVGTAATPQEGKEKSLLKELGVALLLLSPALVPLLLLRPRRA